MSNSPDKLPRRIHSSVVALAVAMGISTGICHADPGSSPAGLTPTPSAEQSQRLAERQTEFISWKFGMFIHFGMSTFDDSEWANGYEDPGLFTPGKLDCGQWADAARAAGMKYAVLTVKHTGGWCLWQSKVTTHGMQSFENYKQGKGDIVQEFVEAFRARGLKVGLYYCAPGNYDGAASWQRSLPPGKPSLHGMPPEAEGDYPGFMKKQFTELLTNYGPIDLFWCDQYMVGISGADWWGLKEHIQSIQPNCLVLANNAHHPKTTDIASYEVLAGGGLPPDGNKIPSEVSDCICTGNVSGNWFWHKTQNKDNLRSVESIMESFKVCESKYANYLLNVPPDATGRLPEIFVERLKEVGQRIETPVTKP